MTKTATADPSERVKTARAQLEALTAELQGAKWKVRAASGQLREAEAAEKWSEAQRLREQLPGLSHDVESIEEKHKQALAVVAEAEEAVKAAGLRRYQAIILPLISAGEKFLERIEQERLFRQQRGHELGGSFYLNSGIAQYPIFGLECWLKEARKRAAQLFGERK